MTKRDLKAQCDNQANRNQFEESGITIVEKIDDE